MLSLKIDLLSWKEKATTIRIDLCTSQRYNDIKFKKPYLVVLEVLEYEDHHLKKSNLYCCITKQIPLIYDYEKFQQKDNEDWHYDQNKKRSCTRFQNVRYVYFSYNIWRLK